MLMHQLLEFWRRLNTPPQTLISVAESPDDPVMFGEQLRRLQDSLHRANQPEVVIENGLQL